MAGVSIGSIGWDLFANTVGFESDFGRAARIAQRDSERIRATVNKALGAIGVGVSVAGFTSWIGGALKAQDAADELGQKLGITTEAASRLSAQAKFTAGDAEGMGKAFLKLNQNAVAAAGGVKEQSATFKSLGIDVKDANGHVKNADQLVLDIAGKLSQYRDGAEKTALAQKLFGKSGADMVPLLNMGRDGIIDLNNTIDDLGLKVSGPAGQAAARFADNIDTLGMVSDGVANQIAGALAPALSDLTDQAVKFFRSGDWKATLAGIRDGTQWVVDNIDSIGRVVKLVGGLFVVHMGMNATKAIAGVGLEFVAAAKKGYELAAAAKLAGANTSQSFLASVGSVGKLNAAIGLVGTAVMGWQIGTYLREEFEVVERAGNVMVFGIVEGWDLLKYQTGMIWAGIKLVAIGAIDAIAEGFAAMLRGLASAADVKIGGINILGNTSKDLLLLADSVSGALTPLDDFKATAAELGTTLEKNHVTNVAMLDDMQKATTATRAAGDGAKGAAAGLTVMTGAGKGAAPVLDGVAENAAASAKRLKELAEASKAWATTLTQLRGAASPMVKVYEDEAQAVRELFAQKRTLIALGANQVAVEADLREALKLTEDAYSQQRAEVIKAQDVKGRVLSDMDQEIRLLGMSAQARRIEEMVIRATADAIAAKKPLTDTEIADLRAGIVVRQQMIDKINLENQAIEDNKRFWQGVGESIYSSLGKAATDVIFRFTSIKDAFKSIGRTLVDEAANVVQRMLTEFAKLAAIKFFTGQGGSIGSLFGQAASSVLGGGFNIGSLLGGGTSAPLGSAANAGGGVSFNNLMSAGQSLIGGFSNVTSAFAGQGVGGLFNASNWMTAGQNVWSGLSSGIGGFFGMGGGAAAFTGAGSLAYGSGTAAAGFGGTFGGGTGAYTAGAGAAAGGGAGAAMTAMLSNPVTWILAGAAASAKYFGEGWRNSENTNNDTLGGKLGGVTMLADKMLQGLGLSAKWAAILSGSSLHTRIFGRKDPVVQSSSLGFNFGDEGASGMMVANIKEKGGWLRSDKRYTKEAPLDAETQAAIDEMFATFQAAIKNSAATLGVEAPAMVAASIKQNFDKAGKLTDTIVTVLGRQWKESMEDGIVRIGAENVIAAVGVSAANATEIAEQWRGSAAKLAEGAQFLVIAQTDINRGAGLLRDPTARSDSSGGLASVTKLIQELQTGGATLAETYVKAVASTALLDTATALMGINLGKSREDVVRFAVGIADAAGGLDQANSLWSNFFDRFYTDAERAKLQFDQAMQSGAAAFTSIGMDIGSFTGEGGAQAFREMLEKQLPSLSAEATVQWLKAAAALGIVIDASANLAATAGTVAGPIAQTKDQIKAINDILDAYAWERTGAGMTTAQRAARDLDRQYQEQVKTFEANAGTLEQRNQLEKEYAESVAAMNADFKRQRDAILGGNDWELSLVGMTDNERQVAEINKRYAEQRAALEQLGVTQEELDRLEKQRIATLGNLAAATAAADAAQAAANRKQIDDIIAGNDWDIALAGMTEYERQVAQVNKGYDAQIANLRSLGATQADIDKIEKQRDATLGNLSATQAKQLAAERAQAAMQYDALALSIRNMGIELTDYERQMADANGWYSETVAELDRLAIAAGRTGANAKDLANAEDELGRRRAVAMANLMAQTQQQVTQLYGTVISRQIKDLEKKLQGRDGSMGPSGAIDFQYFKDQRLLAELKAKDEEDRARLERMSGVNALVGNLGQLLTIPGKTLDGLAKEFGLPLDQLASDLGLTGEALDKYVRDQAARANATLTLNDTVKDKVGISNAHLKTLVDHFRGVDTGGSDRQLGTKAADRSGTKEPIVDIASKREEKREAEVKKQVDQMGQVVSLLEKLLDTHGDLVDITQEELAVLRSMQAQRRGLEYDNRIRKPA